jgi:hypothetical protein
MNGIFMSTGYMKNMIKVQRMKSRRNNRITDVVNIHTYTICGPILVVDIVPLCIVNFSSSPVMQLVVSESRYQLGSVPLEGHVIAASQLSGMYSSSNLYQ